MSSFVSIDRTIFQTIDADGNVTDTSYGFRIYDDHATCYDNLVDNLDDLKSLTHEELIARAQGLNEQAADMIEFAITNGLPIIVNGTDVNPRRNSIASPRV
jgi:hypothetical protein